jgi:NAD(P)-dependent dehydrogenase (short-subunit alcohol dehydrogenase family)
VAVREDVSREEGARAIVEAVLDSFGRLEGVINNAGIVGPSPCRTPASRSTNATWTSTTSAPS